jgi:N-acetylneuraminic acid mutarotase
MKKKHTALFGSLSLQLVLCSAAVCSMITGTLLAFVNPQARAKTSHPAGAGLTFAERVSHQRAIEDVYWRHRMWPKENANPKPSLDAVMSQAQLEKKVRNHLRNSQALEDYWQQPITAQQLQAEIDRMAQNTRQPEVLQELFEALGNDPFVIAECLARPTLAERLLAHPKFERVKQQSRTFDQTVAAGANYTLPTISGGACIEDAWTPTELTGAPDPRELHTAVWTGTEMIVWGGDDRPSGKFVTLNTGARYNLVTDTWTATSTINAPSPRYIHTAVWSGSEMIVWGGNGENFAPLNTGARYNPGLDTWTTTSTTNAPSARAGHTAVWTGSEMIVWGGGTSGPTYFNTGGRYNPSTNSWTPTSTVNAPDSRENLAAVWSGSEMIVWGGAGQNGASNTGGRYNPGTDSWTATSTMNAPEGRVDFTGVWSGDEMIVWGGYHPPSSLLNSGGRYNPNTDTWLPTPTVNAPDPRAVHTAVWTGEEMIVWGGNAFGIPPPLFNTGGRYNLITDSWIATSTTNAPAGRFRHTAVWSGSKMIVWGGFGHLGTLNTGGRYCVRSPIPCVGRCSPTPRPRPSPHQRPSPPPGIDGTWTVTGSLNTGRFLHTATLLPNGLVLIVGGNDPHNTTRSSELYDPASGSWTATGSLNTGRFRHTATLLTNGKVLVAGGDFGNGTVASAELYDPATGTWTFTGSLNTARDEHTATLLPGGKVLVAGGSDSTTFISATAELYDPLSGIWTATNNLNTARELHTATLLPNGKVLVAGGIDSTFHGIASAELYDPANGTWTVTGNLNRARAAHTATLLPNGMTLVTGEGNHLPTAELYDSSSGTWTVTASLNTGRVEHTATLLPNGMVLVAGGWDTGSTSAELYDTTSGTWTFTGSLNNARAGHTATLLPNGVVLAAGGEAPMILTSAELYHTPTRTPTAKNRNAYTHP